MARTKHNRSRGVVELHILHTGKGNAVAAGTVVGACGGAIVAVSAASLLYAGWEGTAEQASLKRLIRGCCMDASPKVHHSHWSNDGLAALRGFQQPQRRQVLHADWSGVC